MNTDALVMALLAIADLMFLVYLRRREARRVRLERMAASLVMAVRRENRLEEMRETRSLAAAIEEHAGRAERRESEMYA